MSELKPCINSAVQHPAANHLTVLSARGHDIDVGPFFVACRYCFCKGPHADTRQSAITAWNALPRTVQAAPSDRERRLVKDAYFEGFCAGESSTIGEPEEYWDKSEARAALADTTNNDGG